MFGLLEKPAGSICRVTDLVQVGGEGIRRMRQVCVCVCMCICVCVCVGHVGVQEGIVLGLVFYPNLLLVK
jgi:hypothetical protein